LAQARQSICFHVASKHLVLLRLLFPEAFNLNEVRYHSLQRNSDSPGERPRSDILKIQGVNNLNRVLAGFLCFALVAAPATAARFTADDVVRTIRVSDPQIAPDGKSIVVVVSRPNFKEDKYDSELVLIDVATRSQRSLTNGRVVRGYPRWSPTGDRLAYIADDSDHKSQVYVLPMAGGDSMQLTHSAGPVTQFAWKPDGATLAYAAVDEAPKREGEAKFLDAFEVGANDALVTGPSQSTHIWLIAAGGGDARRLTSGKWSLPVSFPPAAPASPINWTPDGKQIVFVKAVTPLSGDAEHTQVQLLDAATGQTRSVTDRILFESYPVISPDGTNIAYWYPMEGKPWNLNEIRVRPIALNGIGTGDRSMTTMIDRNICRALWTSDGKSLLTGANDRTTVGLWLSPLDGPARRIPLGNVTPSNPYWVDLNLGPKNQLALTGTTPDRATELYYLPTLDSLPIRLTDFNASLDALERGKSETVTWSSDRIELDGVVTYPPDFTATKKYPLVLYVHGGPTSASKETFNPPVQYMAAQGWVVFEPNYRGSDNLGNKFFASIYRDAGAGPGRDVMAGVAMLEKRGFVDSSRMAVSGWSYGGYMTTWLLGHYNVWKAAVAGASVTDWVNMYTTSDGSVTIADLLLGGSPYSGDNIKLYRDQSPIDFAQNIKAPTLILHDTGDTRVPIANSYELFRVLKDNGVITQFIAYPISGHSPADPIRSRDVRKRWVEWIAKYVGTEAVTDTASK
jgi:dipeptidyl aminopeptidase/acylaminoacyl peptidase